MSDTRCVLPHLALAVQNYGDICACNINKQSYKHQDKLYTIDQGPLSDVWYSPTKQEIIDALDNNQRHPSCRACWDIEDSGKQSTRQKMNERFKDLEARQDQPRIMIIKPGNTCNAACRMCNPATSSSWYHDDFERSKSKNPRLDFKTYIRGFESVRQSFARDNPNFWPTMLDWHGGLEYLEIYGGEPWLISGLWENLEQAVRSGHSQHIDISLNTNCSQWNTDYMDILSRFREVQIKLSFDSDDARQFEYIRHKLDFDTCVTNAKKFIDFGRQYQWNTDVICTVSNLNIGDLDRIYLGLKNLFDAPVGADNIVTGPDEYYDIRHLPRTLKLMLREKYQSIEPLKNVANFMSQTIPGCDLWWPKFCMETDRLDKIRNQSFREAMPQWWQVLEPYWDYTKPHREWF